MVRCARRDRVTSPVADEGPCGQRITPGTGPFVPDFDDTGEHPGAEPAFIVRNRSFDDTGGRIALVTRRRRAISGGAGESPAGG